MCCDCSGIIHNKGARKRHVLNQQRLLDLGYITRAIIKKSRIEIAKPEESPSQRKLTDKESTLQTLDSENSTPRAPLTLDSSQEAMTYHS